MMSTLMAIGLLFIVMAFFSLIEFFIPLQARGIWGRRHIGPNIVLTLTSFATGLLFNALLLVGFVLMQQAGLGLFNMIALPPAIETAGAIIVLDLAWYATHVSMHKFTALWRFHVTHHSDLQVDVTTTYRQNPGESVIRYAFLAAFGLAVGASPLAFAIYRIWSAVHGQFEHSNIRLPRWLDTAITLVWSSPNMHKLHHSSEPRFTDTNFGNIFSAWDRLFGTFTPSRLGTNVHYGLQGMDTEAHQTALALLIGPFQTSTPESGLAIPGAAHPSVLG